MKKTETDIRRYDSFAIGVDESISDLANLKSFLIYHRSFLDSLGLLNEAKWL